MLTIEEIQQECGTLLRGSREVRNATVERLWKSASFRAVLRQMPGFTFHEVAAQIVNGQQPGMAMLEAALATASGMKTD